MRLLAAKSQESATDDDQNTDRSDASLVTAAQREPAHFDLLFDRYWDRVFRFCYVRLNDWHLAEDVASQTFLQAMRALTTFDPAHPDKSFRAWLFTIARHEVAGLHRRNLRHPIVGFDDAPEIEDRADSPEEQAIAAERHAQLQQLLASLPADQRDLLELRLARCFPRLKSANTGQIAGGSSESSVAHRADPSPRVQPR